MKIFSLVGALVLLSLSASAEIWDAQYLERLKNSQVEGMDEVIEALQLAPDSGCFGGAFSSSSVRDPFFPKTWLDDNRANRSSLKDELKYYSIKNEKIGFPAIEPVANWYLDSHKEDEVCAVKITGNDPERKVFYYRLTTFSSLKAVPSGYRVTHQYHCGACSTLKDLYVYKTREDLTKPAALCGLLFPLSLQKECMKGIGFTEACAEVWAYNARATRDRCALTCAKSRVTRHFTEVSPLDLANHTLDPCLACDEYVSGPGFKYGAGRTRRSSGLKSSIERKAGEIYKHTNHDYFNEKGLAEDPIALTN